MTQEKPKEKTGPDATPRIGLDLGRQILDDQGGNGPQDPQSGIEEERIRQRAYEIWGSEGRTGHPEDHWYRAELELRGATQDRSEATVEDTPPVAAVEAMAAVSEQPAGEAVAQKKPRRKRTS